MSIKHPAGRCVEQNTVIKVILVLQLNGLYGYCFTGSRESTKSSLDMIVLLIQPVVNQIRHCDISFCVYWPMQGPEAVTSWPSFISAPCYSDLKIICLANGIQWKSNNSLCEGLFSQLITWTDTRNISHLNFLLYNWIQCKYFKMISRNITTGETAVWLRAICRLQNKLPVGIFHNPHRLQSFLPRTHPALKDRHTVAPAGDSYTWQWVRLTFRKVLS